MTVDSKLSEIMVNLNNSDRCELTSRDILFESSELKYLNMFPHCLDRCIKMDLNEQLLSSLNEFVSGDKVKHIQQLLTKGADPNAVDSCGNRPIHLAIMNSPGNFELVLEIIGFGADLNVVNNYGSTPLTFSLEKRCHKTTEILIKRRIDLSFQCQRGWTAVMIASMIGDLWSVRILLEHGANVNTYDATKKTALMYAIEGNYPKVIKELLEYGANPAMRDATNKTALCTYLEKPYPDLDVINELLLHCACFIGLEKNAQASFMKIMKICLRGKPPYHACVRTIIKIQMLLTCDHRSVSEFEDWYDFAQDCCSEIRYMGGNVIGRCNNVRTLLVRSLQGCMLKERELEELLPVVANNCFPIYSDILRAHLRKPFLRNKFMNMRMYAKKEGKNEIILLNSDVNLMLKSYLSDDDVTNFVLASSSIKTDSHEKIMYSSLYPKGKSYSWKDLTDE
ncbi:hypothetical protein AVEN_163205-1 [Araneus ventricosus]|uniref:Uncharacterized protein n=1 Tax=Araneus ventricosus TaxID=182803 RepID=A0A4Y2I820_ARAVE|nr:hypothetical protein AVEN_163205-1 [Araneus ventricosus]